MDWHSTIPTDLPTINLDPIRINQVVGNLLSNAIKYTPTGGAITLSAESDDSELRIKVEDTGPGIIREEQDRVFEPFFRSQQERRFPQGLGLGLTIARDLVEAHGGRMDLASRPGEGSTFTIHLPLETLS